MLHHLISRHASLFAAFVLVVGLSLSACDSAEPLDAAEGPGANAGAQTIAFSGDFSVPDGCYTTITAYYDPPSIPTSYPNGVWTLTSNTNEASIVSQTGNKVTIGGLNQGHVVLNYFGDWGRIPNHVYITAPEVCPSIAVE